MYGSNKFNPTLNERTKMIDLFKTRSHLSQQPLYHVRGNHDFEYPYDYYLQYSLMHANWLPRYKWYSESFTLKDDQKKKALFLFIDTDLIFCAYNIKRMANCTVSDQEEYILQDQWLTQELANSQNDTSIIWKFVVAHHPIFQKQELDELVLVMDLLHNFMKYKVDFYLNGHEHMQLHAFFERDIQKHNSELKYNDFYDNLSLKNRSNMNTNYFWRNTTTFTQRQSLDQGILTFKKSENLLHQVIDGSGGKDMHFSNQNQRSRGQYSFIQSQYFGFTHLKITSKEVEFTFKSSEFAHFLNGLSSSFIPNAFDQMKIKVINDL
ncbi:acid phosphatase [Stylonychia lemnae]|uniref:Acid phosphatase n=1 Tax=Stylonychia lemnae TaxID=5949 RepID=A0A077ZV84_STYLE|nr:acid phosphatase [Stylonychia lemnae]|eukprot:CDW72316.1 acid phosphatase [Stylonychia lemnae]